MNAYVPPRWAREQREQLMRSLEGERVLRWPLYSILVIAAVIAVAGFVQGGF